MLVLAPEDRAALHTPAMQCTTALLCALGVFASIMGSGAQPTAPEPPPWTSPKPPPAIPPTEGMPPLPFPTVPARVQQKKAQPAPVTLIMRLTSPDPEDWSRTPNDLGGLLEKFKTETGERFGFDQTTIADLALGSRMPPLVYRSGYKAFKLTEPEVVKLREYCTRGGTIVFNALMGNPAAYEAAKQAAAQLFPQSPMKRLGIDHAIFRAFHPIHSVTYRDRMKKDGLATEDVPHLEGIDVGERTAIIISRWDLSLGWAGDAHESWSYVDEDSRKIGVNILAYVLSKDAFRQ